MDAILMEARTLSVSIACDPQRVYAFASDATNLPRWSFFESVRPTERGFELATRGGLVTLRFAAANELGVLDHEVTLASGQVVRVPMRVVANGSGSEVLFTLFRPADMPLEAFEADAAQVTADLARLKGVLEGASE